MNYSFGAQKTKKDFRDYKLHVVSGKQHPKEFTLSTSEIKDQGFVSSCV